jgi:hypothetical protein
MSYLESARSFVTRYAEVGAGLTPLPPVARSRRAEE